MCRFIIYKSTQTIRLDHLLTRPAHSIINQSFDSRLRIDYRRPINGDGFGVGYYPDDIEEDEEKGPCVYCATTPAWNNMNLDRLASKTRSKLVFGHVRASTSGVLAETNCHPFVYHTLMFMHNGGIPLFNHIKRQMCDHMENKYFMFVQGSTDSEMCFALFLDAMDKLGHDPADPLGRFPAEVLQQALQKVIELVKQWTREAAAAHGLADEPNLLNLAVTDGQTVVVSRYVTSKTEEAASLYYSAGNRFHEYAPGQYRMERSHRLNSIAIVASEPLTFERSDWIAIPTNTVLTIRDQTVLLYPILDEYYGAGPQGRSSDLVISKGLASPLVPGDSQEGVPPLGPEGRAGESRQAALAGRAG